jgi:hypothetical protein
MIKPGPCKVLTSEQPGTLFEQVQPNKLQLQIVLGRQYFLTGGNS